jgi:hypothetical protein
MMLRKNLAGTLAGTGAQWEQGAQRNLPEVKISIREKENVKARSARQELWEDKAQHLISIRVANPGRASQEKPSVHKRQPGELEEAQPQALAGVILHNR